MAPYSPLRYRSVYYRWLPSHGSVLAAIVPATAAALAINVVLLVVRAELEIKVGISLAAHSLFGFLLSFLLVMRTTMAYQRYMEGYSAMSNMICAARTSTREVLVACAASDDVVARCIRYIKAYLYVAVKHLRSEPLELETLPEGLLTNREAMYLSPRSRRSLLIIGWLAIEFEALYAMSAISDFHRLHLLAHLKSLTDAFMAATRVRAMFIPFPFAQVFTVALSVYCFTLPFGLIPTFGRWSVAFTAFACFVIFGTAEVALRLETAFAHYKGFDPIPLDDIVAAATEDMDAYVAQFSDFRRGLTFHRSALNDAGASVDDTMRDEWINLNSLAAHELGPPGEMTHTENTALGMAIDTDSVPYEVAAAVADLVDLDASIEHARAASALGAPAAAAAESAPTGTVVDDSSTAGGRSGMVPLEVNP